MIYTLYTDTGKSPSSVDWREHDKNVYVLRCQIDRDAGPAVIILYFNHADAAVYYYYTPRHIIIHYVNTTIRYIIILSSAFVNMAWDRVRRSLVVGGSGVDFLSEPFVRLRRARRYLASRIGSAVLTAPVQVYNICFRGFVMIITTRLLFYKRVQTTMVMLFTLYYYINIMSIKTYKNFEIHYQHNRPRFSHIYLITIYLNAIWAHHKCFKGTTNNNNILYTCDAVFKRKTI